MDNNNEVVKHTRIETLIYEDKKKVVDDMYPTGNISELTEMGMEKLDTFESLPKDIYALLNKAKPKVKDDEQLSEKAKLFNKQLLNSIQENKKFSVLKKLTMNGDLESIEGARELIEYMVNNLDSLLENITGDEGTLDELEENRELLDKKQEQLNKQLEVLENMKLQGMDTKGVQKKVESLQKQVAYLSKKQKDLEDFTKGYAARNKEKIDKQIDEALDIAIDKVQEVKDQLDSWSTLDGRPEEIEGKKELLEKVNKSSKFKEMAKHIGKLRRLAQAKSKSSYQYGRGANCGIEFGDDLNRVIPSELALLGTKETKPLFYIKLAQKQLKLYKKREKIKKGRGHIIFCGDESGSVYGGAEYWMKAMAIAMLDISVSEKRNFAYIHFSNKVELDEVDYTNYNEDTIMSIAQKFLNGGTDFQKPLSLAKELLTKDDSKDKYKGADIVFCTDGNCGVSKEWLDEFLEWKEETDTKVIGILLDRGNSYVSDVTLKKFCNKVYRTSELTETEISENVFSDVL